MSKLEKQEQSIDLISLDFIKDLKNSIISSRYNVAKIANMESLKLNFSIGKMIDDKFQNEKWGGKILDKISERLQQELPGLRGFSGENLKRMRRFYIEWSQYEAIRAFKDNYLLDFVNIEDSDDEIDERILEKEIVLNIKNFLMSLGSDFSFLGSQYRLKIEEDEYYIDLLFFHRGLQSLIAFELKKGKFKPEYVGKMNFYLSALDDLVKQPHENPSIGIILSKRRIIKKLNIVLEILINLWELHLLQQAKIYQKNIKMLYLIRKF